VLALGLVLCRPEVASAGVFISEFMAVNNTVLKDEDGAYSDWIELYNSGSNSVNLAGWYLSNQSTNLTQWRFPSTNLAAHGFLVVFASNKNRAVAGAPLHTSFKLSGSGEYVALVMPDGVTKTSEFAPAFPPQVADVSYGYVMSTSTDATLAGPPGYLARPTPGAWNNTTASPVVPGTVSFWPPAGVYTSLSLTITLAAPSGAQAIYYTVDGSTPTASSAVYTGSILLTTNAAFRARASFSGVWGAVTAANYLLGDYSVSKFTSNLPLVLVDTLGQTIPDGSKVSAYGVFIPTNATTGRVSLTSAPDYIGRLGIGLHGSSSLSFPKQPFAIELDSEQDTSLNYPLLNFPSGNDWLLYPSYDDKTFLNNVLTEEIFRAMGHYAVRCQYVELFLRSTRGKINIEDYQGIYILIERIRIDPNRVAIAELSSADNAMPQVSGGYIISKDKINDATDVLINTSSGQQLIVNRPAPDVLTPAQYSYMASYVSQLEAALYGSQWLDPDLGYAAYLDTDSFVDYHWIVEYSKNIDGIRISNYMSKDRLGKLSEGPIWDWDLSWGNANYAEGGKTNGWYYQQLGDSDDIWLRRLRTDPDFFQKIIDRWGALRLNVFNPTNLFARVDQLTNYLWEAQARDFATWPRLGTYVWPNPNGAAGGWDVDYVNPTTYDGIISQFKIFVLGRYLWIDQQFLPAPVLSTNGGLLSFQVAVGSTYFTLDASDPRAGGGGIAGSARLYTGATPLSSNVAIVARTFYTNAWSPALRALWISQVPALRITEINYHPLPPPTNSPYSDKDFEFIEVQNTGTNVIDLAGARIGGGVNYVFAPNQLTSAGIATSNNFDGPGTPFLASTLAQPPGPYLTNNGPAGSYLRLLDSTTNISRNRITFDQTSTGRCDRLALDFDFRASTSGPSNSLSGSVLQDFDLPGTSYTLSHNGSVAPVILPADAGSAGSFLRLVPSSGAQLGAVAFPLVAQGAFNSVVATFDFRITPPASGTPADGLGFALLSTAAYGSTGAGPLFSEEPNLSGSLGVGFDVYANASTAQEPNNNHVSLHWNSSQIGNAFTPSFLLSNGKFNRAQIIVSFAGNNAYVTVRLTPDIDGTPGPTESVMENVLVTGVVPYQARVAFGARTGGAWASHDLDNVSVAFSQTAANAAGLSLLLLPADQFGTTGRGTTASTFTDVPLVSNALALDLAFSPSGLFNDASLYWNRALSASVPLPLQTISLASGVFHHAHVQLDATNGHVSTTWTLTPNSLGVPGTPVVVFTNLSLNGPTLGNTRLELAARNGGLVSTVDIDNVLAQSYSWEPLLLKPGDSVVVVHNLPAFTSRYGSGLPVAGEFSGSLSNQGDELTLFGPLGEPILDFWYSPAWYPSTDGGGFSLVAVDPNASSTAWGLAGNWRPSTELNGSPGTNDFPQGVPALTISAGASPGQLTLSWPALSGPFDLYRAPALGAGAPWTMVTVAPILSANRWSVALPIDQAAWFYRLQQR